MKRRRKPKTAARIGEPSNHATAGVVGGETDRADAHLELATTGELIDEIRRRVDAGHVGLDYRGVP
ncbi:MAG: hypothetical protein J2P16_00085 [Mycobacterium sp.]|nr:hypothetical protein [Mycobacterium sp.]